MLRQIVILVVLGVALAAPSSKIEGDLATSLKSKSSVNIFVSFHGGNKHALQKSAHLTFATRGERVTHLVDNLKSLAEKSQAGALKLVQGTTAAYKQYWVNNELFVKGANAQLVNDLAALPEVAEIREERIVQLEKVSIENEDISPMAEWNMDKIEAAGAWALPGGSSGAGVVVASVDTGVLSTHEALKNNFRESYGWYDPYDKTPVPSDSYGTGTHVMGILAGSGGIGVAPGAQWITCRGCSAISCTESALIECGQWVICPFLPDGSVPDCTKAPQVVANSWGGGQGQTWYNGVIDAWKAVNIIPVFGVGGSGPDCGLVGSPADQDVIAVGATNEADSISQTSSAGPAGDGKIKPDIVAPGVNIRSAWGAGDNSYFTISGTSMAVPHVAGTAALLLSSNPNLTYDQVKELLEENTDQDLADTGRVCGGIPSTEFPNNQYGHGRVNARKALEAAINNP